MKTNIIVAINYENNWQTSNINKPCLAWTTYKYINHKICASIVEFVPKIHNKMSLNIDNIFFIEIITSALNNPNNKCYYELCFNYI